MILLTYIIIALVSLALSASVVNHSFTKKAIGNTKVVNNKVNTAKSQSVSPNDDIKKLAAQQKNQLDNSYTKLFGRTPQVGDECAQLGNQKKLTFEEKALRKENKVRYGAQWAIPSKKVNIYGRKMIGWGPSAYLFDFLDPLMQKEFAESFEKIYEDAMKIIPEFNVLDPYSLENMTGQRGSEEELLKKIETLAWNNNLNKSNFDSIAWKLSINIPKVDKLIKEWNWNYDKTSPEPAKAMVDKYDFNGDGRLSPKELMIAMIHSNKPILGTMQCINCLDDIVRNLIDPIYMYIDCNQDEKISSENLWDGLVKLVRNSNGYNFYKCMVNGKNPRTSIANDFIIKTKKTMDGFISKTEFRMGILDGYWSRQVDDYKVNKVDQINMKGLRWSPDGVVDIGCDKFTGSEEE